MLGPKCRIPSPFLFPRSTKRAAREANTLARHLLIFSFILAHNKKRSNESLLRF